MEPLPRQLQAISSRKRILANTSITSRQIPLLHQAALHSLLKVETLRVRIIHSPLEYLLNLETSRKNCLDSQPVAAHSLPNQSNHL